jgi:hypothetical protein
MYPFSTGLLLLLLIATATTLCIHVLFPPLLLLDLVGAGIVDGDAILTEARTL